MATFRSAAGSGAHFRKRMLAFSVARVVAQPAPPKAGKHHPALKPNPCEKIGPVHFSGGRGTWAVRWDFFWRWIYGVVFSGLMNGGQVASEIRVAKKSCEGGGGGGEGRG